MESLANLESFLRSAEPGGFSAAARRLALTPAAISRNVAMLERNLGVRLFHRSTRKLTLTDAGERFLLAIKDNLEGLQQAVCDLAADGGEPAGVLKVSMGLDFGADYILPLLPAFLARYPGIRPDWRFDDAAGRPDCGRLRCGDWRRHRAWRRASSPARSHHCISLRLRRRPIRNRTPPADPAGLMAFDGIAWRSSRTGRIRERIMRDAAGTEICVRLKETIVLDDPEATCRAALLGLGVTLIAVCHALPHLERGTLVRLVPRWYADSGPISIYYANRTLLPAKTRGFVDFVIEAFKRDRLAERFAGSLG